MFRRGTVNSNRYIACYRVSTQRQGRSGLGLEAQRKAVIDRLSGRGELISEYTEIESGRKNERPGLTHALLDCRLHLATLHIADLRRPAPPAPVPSEVHRHGS